jgi:hypothetical protein
MKTFYTSYTKQVQEQTYYFVKRYLAFPEYKGVSDVLEGYGMHTDFNKACSIAGIHDPQIREQLFADMEAAAPQGKVIELNQVVFNSKSIVM